MPLYLFYIMMQKGKNDQKLKSRGPALRIHLASFLSQNKNQKRFS